MEIIEEKEHGEFKQEGITNYVIIARNEKEALHNIPYLADNLRLDAEDPAFKNKGGVNYRGNGWRMFYLHNPIQLRKLDRIYFLKVGNYMAREDFKKIDVEMKVCRIGGRVVGED